MLSKIEKAFEEYAGFDELTEDQKLMFSASRQGFREGAKWALNEAINILFSFGTESEHERKMKVKELLK